MLPSLRSRKKKSREWEFLPSYRVNERAESSMMAKSALRTSIEEKQRATFTSFPADFKQKLETQETWREDKR